MDDETGGFERSVVQDWNTAPQAVQYITGIAEKQPDELLETVITQGFDTWNDFSLKNLWDVLGPASDLLERISDVIKSDVIDWLDDKWNEMTTANGNMVTHEIFI